MRKLTYPYGQRRGRSYGSVLRAGLLGVLHYDVLHRGMTRPASRTPQGGAPVDISSYDPGWPAKFDAERALIEPALLPWLAGLVEHIGSTAIPGMPAKPVIDIM